MDKHQTNNLPPNYDTSACEFIDRNRREVTLSKNDGVEIKRNVSFVEKYQENGTSELMLPLQPIANPFESVTPLQPITSQPITS